MASAGDVPPHGYSRSRFACVEHSFSTAFVRRIVGCVSRNYCRCPVRVSLWHARGPGDISNQDANGGASSVRYRPNTNLELVSDWLTKVLIGVGLVEIKQLGGVLNRLGMAVEVSLGGALVGTSVITQIVAVTFVVLGFLCGFLWTRISYGRLQTVVDRGIEDYLRSALGESERKRVKVQEEKEKVQEEKEKVQSVITQIAEREIPISQKPVPVAKTLEEPATEESPWREDVHQQVEKFRNAEPDWDRDVALEIFQEKFDLSQEKNGRRFEAEIALALGSALLIKLRVRRVTGNALTGPVAFLLHPTFTQSVLYAEPIGDVAEVRIASAGTFTAIAILDRGNTILCYDLSKLPDAPDWFKGK